MLTKESKAPIEFSFAAIVTGQCGDTITTKLVIENGCISNIEQIHKGCVYTAVCANIVTSIVKNLTLEEALKITPEMIANKIINLPKDHFHCAKLAINSLGEAISGYYAKQRS